MAGGRGKFGTVNGHTMFECSSWMQKAVRRSLPGDAMYAAVELEMSGYGEYMWRRLKAIASEDIGPADNSLPSLLDALHRSWQEFQGREQKTDRLFLGHAILALCMAPKNRIVDNFQIVHYATHHEVREVPDWVFDMHTQRGKRMGRGVDHFFDESATIDKDMAARLHVLGRTDPYEHRARELKTKGIETPPKTVRNKTERQRTLEESMTGGDDG